MGLLIKLPQAPAPDGSHSLGMADLKAKVGSSCVWYATEWLLVCQT